VATTPSAPVTVTKPATQTWLQKHERLIIAISLLGVVLFLGQKFLDRRAEIADLKATQAQQQLQQQISHDKDLAAATTTQQQQYAQLLSTLSAQNAQLATAMSARQVVTQQAQAVDKTLPLPELATHWVGMLNLQPNDIQNTSAGLTVSDNGARTTVQQLELIPQLQQDYKDEQQVAANKDTQIASLGTSVNGLNTLVAGLNTQLTYQTKACTAEVNKVKKDAARSKAKWFGAGFIGGLLTGLGIK
jgi:hypothetical protein